MSVTIQLETSQDQYAKRGLFGKISITGQHNHSTSNAEALSLLPPPASLRSVFEGYFFDGQGTSEAARFHTEKMELADCTEVDLADATKNPKYRTVQHWHVQWLAKHQGPRTGDGMIDPPESMETQPSDVHTSPVIVPSDSTSIIQSIHCHIDRLHEQFGSSPTGCARALRRLQNVHTRSQWETFWHSFGGAVPQRHHHRAAIRVQPTSLARRRPGISRGCKRLPSGRPLSSDPMRRKAKRPRNLSYNVQQNQPNAKSHGDGH